MGGPVSWHPKLFLSSQMLLALPVTLWLLLPSLDHSEATCIVSRKQPDCAERTALFPSNLSVWILKPELRVTFVCNKIVRFEIFLAHLNI